MALIKGKQIADATIVADKLVAGAVTVDKIANDSINRVLLLRRRGR